MDTIRKSPYGLVLGMTCLVISAAAGSHSQQSTQTGQTHSPVSQQSSTDATPHEEMKFKLLIMSNGLIKSGFSFGGMVYETSAHVKVDVKIVHLRSHEGAKKEYDDQLKEAVRVIEQGKVQDKPATKPATTEDRAVIVVPNTATDCKELFTILATAGTVRFVFNSPAPSMPCSNLKNRLSATRAWMTDLLSVSQ